MTVVSMKHLLEAGVHFGHQTRRWNPKMKPYIFTDRNGIYILDLEKTLRLLEEAHNFIRDIVADGGEVLFVGTKKQAQEAVRDEALRCGMPFVHNRWLGGTLTNFKTIIKRISRLNELEKMQEDGMFDVLPKKEVVRLRHELDKLKRNHAGIRHMSKLPSAVFVIDPHKENIAVLEAIRLHIPIVGIVDTNCDPDEVNYLIPGNDDAIRAVALITRVIADAVVEGRERRPKPEAAAEFAETAPETFTLDEPVREVSKKTSPDIVSDENDNEAELEVDTEEAAATEE